MTKRAAMSALRKASRLRDAVSMPYENRILELRRMGLLEDVLYIAPLWVPRGKEVLTYLGCEYMASLLLDGAPIEALP